MYFPTLSDGTPLAQQVARLYDAERTMHGHLARGDFLAAFTETTRVAEALNQIEQELENYREDVDGFWTALDDLRAELRDSDEVIAALAEYVEGETP